MTALKKELHSVHDYTVRRVVEVGAELTDQLKSDIEKARKEDLQRVEDFITDQIAAKYQKTIREYMSIPDNCLLRAHILHDDEELMKMTAEDVEKLKQDIVKLQEDIKRVRLDCIKHYSKTNLNNNSHHFKNATFIQGLSNENEGYEQISEEFITNNQMIQRAREILDVNIDTSLLRDNAKKIKEMQQVTEKETE